MCYNFVVSFNRSLLMISTRHLDVNRVILKEYELSRAPSRLIFLYILTPTTTPVTVKDETPIRTTASMNFDIPRVEEGSATSGIGGRIVRPASSPYPFSHAGDAV